MSKAIFFDIDGTLLNSLEGLNTIAPAVKKSIKKLQENNNHVFIATGRPYAFLCKDILDFGFDGFVLMNGSLLLTKDKSSFYGDPFDKALLKKLLKQFEEYNIEYILQDETYSYLKEDFKKLKNLYDNIGIDDTYIKTDYDLDTINVYKIEMICKNKQGLNFCKSLENDEFRCIHYDGFNLFELSSKRNSKASGILKILDNYNVHIDSSYAFGDGENDIEMLNTVGCGIAMGNASENIKKHADKITLSVAEDGVAYGINKYILAD